ncbi:MAG: hydrolase [Anaerovoracaceae bacterium]
MSFITKDDTVLVVVDLQERLMPAMSGREMLEQKAAKLIKGAKVFDLPMIITQQYTKGIGPTAEVIAEAIGDFQHVEKTSFSCMRNAEFVEKLKAFGKKNVIICGVEAHICVLQTTLQLMEEGYNVYLAVDCIASRDEDDKLWGITRMGEAGAVITTYESVLYELLQDSKAEGFKEISAIVK